MGLNREELVQKLAEYYTELNVIHPFREGNGRTQRLLFLHIVINCGFTISFESIRADEWIQANIIGFEEADYQPMASIFDRCLSE